MAESTENLLKKLVFGLVGTLSTVAVKYLSNISESLAALKTESAQIHQTVTAHDKQLNTIESLSTSVHTIESVIKINSGRIDRLEEKERYDKRQ